MSDRVFGVLNRDRRLALVTGSLTFCCLSLLALLAGWAPDGVLRELEFRSIVAMSALAAGLFMRLGSTAFPEAHRAGWRWIGTAMIVVAGTHASLMASAFVSWPAIWTAVGLGGGLIAGACGLVGLLRLGIRPGTPARLLNIVIDAVITGLSVLVVTWVAILEQFVRPGDRPSTSLIVWAALGIALGAVVLQQLSQVPRSWFAPLALMVGASVTAMGASIAGGEIGVGYASATPAPSLLYVIAFGLAALAPLSGSAGMLNKPTEPWLLQRLLPYFAALAAILAMIARYAAGPTLDRPVLVMGAGIGILMVLRQLVATFDERDHRRALVHEATHDFLTDLPNRMLLLDRLELVLRRPPDEGYRHAVLFVDLDEFKSVNDGISHEIGDALLLTVSDRLKASVRPTDLVSRMGGDEFAVLLENATVDQAKLICGRICANVRQPTSLDGHDLRVTCSVGVGWSQPGATPAALLREADAAMYSAKRAGKDSWRIFDAAMQADATDRLHLLQDLAQAAEREQLRLDYQPVVELATGRAVAFEALLRWLDPERGWISIGDAIPALEGSNLLTRLDAWVLRRACAQLAAWHRSGWEVRLHVNVSAREVSHARFPTMLRDLLDETGAPARHLTLEVTESAAYAASASAQQVLRAVRELGVAVSIDDFGTGYSALKRILDHKFDSLKIDRSFVADYQSAQGSAIIRGVVAMANRVGLTVVAEGIETADQARLLKEWGCAYGQGYLFSPPLTLELLETRYRDRVAPELSRMVLAPTT